MPDKNITNIAGLLKTIAATAGIVLVLSGVVGSYFVNSYRLDQLEKEVATLQTIKGDIIQIKSDIKYIKEKIG